MVGIYVLAQKFYLACKKYHRKNAVDKRQLSFFNQVLSFLKSLDLSSDSAAIELGYLQF